MDASDRSNCKKCGGNKQTQPVTTPARLRDLHDVLRAIISI
jgi:hypothetical protein